MFLEISKVYLSFPEKRYCICSLHLAIKAFNQYSMTQKIRFMLLTGSKANLWGTPYKEKAVGAFQGLSRFSRKMVLYLSTKLGIIKP